MNSPAPCSHQVSPTRLITTAAGDTRAGHSDWDVLTARKTILRDRGLQIVEDRRHPYETWSGHEFSVYRDAIYPVDFDLNERHNAFHFKVWLATEGEGLGSSDHGFISGIPHVSARLAFNSLASRLAFDAWFSRYVRFYGENFEHQLPQLPKRTRVSVSPIERDPELPLSNVIEQWSWMTSNCTGGIWFLSDIILFQKECEAVGYRLRWMGG